MLDQYTKIFSRLRTYKNRKKQKEMGSKLDYAA